MTEEQDTVEGVAFPEPEPVEGDELLQELEESMPQGVPNSIHPGRRAEDLVDTGLASLDELLNESVEARQVEEQYKKDRELRRKGYQGMSKEEVEFCNSRMHAFEMAREWDAERAVAVFAQFTCQNCNTAQVVFSRFMERHQHRRVRTTFRWQTVSETKLPTQTVMEDRPVPLCEDCCTDMDIAEPDADSPWLSEVLK